MTLKIYNSLSRKKEVFKPVEEGKVKMYVCGMTVYSDAHIGHARTYYAFDMIRRYLEYKGYSVKYVQNITDVDDKIINAANKEGVDALEYSKRFADICLNDLDRLGIRRADFYPKASETINEMIDLTQRIIKNGYGYEVDGDVYFSVEQFPDYGKLSGQKLENLMEGARVCSTDKKRNPFDFALWKKVKPGEPSWQSPWGEGRPGWHIECSAMSEKNLGLPFDIHGGGMDLRFPHHENEIAQAEAATGKEFAKIWMHIGLLTVEGEKMSKSIGNIVNIKDLIKKWDPEIIRLFFASAHYRNPPDFSETALKNTQKGLVRLYRLKEKLEDISKDSKDEINPEILNEEDTKYYDEINKFKEDFEKAMDDDFNTPQAIAIIFEFINKSNKYLEENQNKELCNYSLKVLTKLALILTLFQPKKDEEKDENNQELSKQLERIIQEDGKKQNGKNVEEKLDLILKIRQEARANKDWDKADKIRDDLEKLGFEIQDTDKGPVWRKIKK